jgi:ABC-type Zn2+ transport system substrate-binding protein/surface adhesin
VPQPQARDIRRITGANSQGVAYGSSRVSADALQGDDQRVAHRRRLIGGSGDSTEGRHEEGDARFRADSAARRIEWGGSGTSDYHGWLQVADAEPGSSTVTIHLSTTSPDDADQVEQALAETLANIGRVVD